MLIAYVSADLECDGPRRKKECEAPAARRSEELGGDCATIRVTGSSITAARVHLATLGKRAGWVRRPGIASGWMCPYCAGVREP